MTTYYTLLTTVGQAKLANALATGIPLQITQMSIGDGNGNPVTPVESRTTMVREVYRAALNTLSTDPDNPNYLIAELDVPMDSGGYVVREVGLFDVDGTLIAYGNFPDTYKPLLTEGSGRELLVRMYLQVSNASSVQLKIDPTVVLATRDWVTSQLNLAHIAPGGSTGQALIKNSNADGDASWTNPGASIINVNAHSEIQTCSTSQTVFTLATLTTVGLAAYIEGARIFDLVVLNASQVQTPTSYTSGQRIMFVQNDPNTALPYFGKATWRLIATGTTVAGGSFIIPDNAGGAAVYTLPPSPADGDSVDWATSSIPFSTNAVRFLRNGNTIMGVADDIQCATDNFCGRLIWRAALNTWRLFQTGVGGA